MNVLIIKISSMGDIIHTLPAVTDASNAISNILFDWIVEETFSEIPQWHPSVRRIIPIRLRSLKKEWYKFNSWKNYYKCIKQLQTQKYDIIIDAQGLLKTSLLITKRITNGIKHGMDYVSVKEPISCCFYHKQHYINKTKHAIERIRELFSCSLKYSLPSYLGQYNIKHIFHSRIQQNNFPYLIFLHATTRLNKHWPELNWNIITQYAIDSGYHIKLPFWTMNEELRVKRLKKRFNQGITILPKLTLNQIAMQISEATATISVDTGLSHLSAALDCPNLTLYGPTNPNLIGTYGRNQMIVQSETQEMKHLNPDYVWKKFEENLNYSY